MAERLKKLPIPLIRLHSGVVNIQGKAMTAFTFNIYIFQNSSSLDELQKRL
jgi:hypothetical protein